MLLKKLLFLCFVLTSTACFGIAQTPPKTIVEHQIFQSRYSLQYYTNNHPDVLKMFDETVSIWQEYAEQGHEEFLIEPLLETVAYAAKKHQGQVRKDPNATPYIIHPIGVARILWEEGGIRNITVLMSALVHDTLEDTDATEVEITAICGPTVCSIVQELTNDPNLSSQENKQIQIDHAPHMSLNAKLVKLADRLYNVRDLRKAPVGWSESDVERYRQWGEKLLDALAGTNVFMEQALKNEIALQRNGGEEEKTSTVSYPVGELGSLWQFPSDHLPVGGNNGNIHFAFWNVLNTDYLGWIEKNGQGLCESLIMTANKSANTGLTLREEMVISNIFEMLRHSMSPRSVLALQEVGAPVYSSLKKRLPSNYSIFPADLNDDRMEDIFIVDTNVFDVVDYSFTKYSFKKNTLSNIALIEKATGLSYCFIQSHVPGGPVDSLPARREFADYVFDHYDPASVTVLMGDMNRSPDYFIKNFEETAATRNIRQPFSILKIPYPTHVDTNREASFIDNLFIASPFNDVPQYADCYENFCNSMESAINLLKDRCVD